MKIAFIDTLGLPYDGTTTYKRGLGGSESAVIYLSQELAALGMDVTVFCHCDADDANPGVYNGVTYVPITNIKNHPCDFDVAVASRSVEVWAPPGMRSTINSKLDLTMFDSLQKNAGLKILWMHDTFCNGDQIVEQLVVNGHIHELFVLSDWHLSYILNCDHGNRRNYEVLKSKTFITRNGARNWLDWIDPKDKNPNQFVYNSSVSKGMKPLLEKIWPQIKHAIPDAMLKVIGGYYRFRPQDPPDEQEQIWQMLRDVHHGKLGVEFTGIITQKQIAQVLADSSLMLYPAAFPETFGISALESLNALTPLVTTRFGALEEIAVDQACYKIDYAIEPNSLFPWINTDHQVQKYVELVLMAHNNKYLLQQKQNYCRIVHPLMGWNQVALQWKQHLYRITARYLSAREFKSTTLHQLRWQQVFGRRHTNLEQHVNFSQPEQQVIVVTPFYNCEKYIARCIESVASQNYTNYFHILRDDASTDNSYQVVQDTVNSLPNEVRKRFRVERNQINQGAVHNQFEILSSVHYISPLEDPIVMLLDGDDCLVNRNDIFSFYNQLFDENTEFTYGSCWSMVDNIPLVAQEYPPHVKASKTYRKHLFNWLMPYTHLRAFRISLFTRIAPESWQDHDHNWYRAGGDTAVFYSLLEQADPQKVRAVQDIIINYNDENPLNDYKVNSQEQNQTARKVIGMKFPNPVDVIKSTPDHVVPINIAPLPTPSVTKTRRILVGIPTARYIEVDTFKSIFDLDKPKNTELAFQYFYGYNVEQVRNIMSNWMLNHEFDYMLNVDSDIIMPSHSLNRLLDIQTSKLAISSGVYIQRKQHEKIPEIFLDNPATGGHRNITIGEVSPPRLLEVAAVGFGCCLVRRDVYQQVGYPWFEYRSNIDFSKVVSEDVDFCIKAASKGFGVIVDTGLRLGHITRTTLEI